VTRLHSDRSGKNCLGIMATTKALDVEGFDPAEWKIHREGHEWRGEEFERRIYQAPEKIEFVGGLFTSEGERLTVLAMLLEIWASTKPSDWVIRWTGKLRWRT